MRWFAVHLAEKVAPLLEKAIKAGAIVDLLKTGWHMAAVESPGRLHVRLYVLARLEVDLLLGFGGTPVARLLEARSLKRCISWAWLDR